MIVRAKTHQMLLIKLVYGTGDGGKGTGEKGRETRDVKFPQPHVPCPLSPVPFPLSPVPILNLTYFLRNITLLKHHAG